MAKVMISMPDDLLASLDAEAQRRGVTRSGLLRDFAEGALSDRQLERERERAREMRRLTANPRGHGGNSVEILRREREERLRKLAGGRGAPE